MWRGDAWNRDFCIPEHRSSAFVASTSPSTAEQSVPEVEAAQCRFHRHPCSIFALSGESDKSVVSDQIRACGRRRHSAYEKAFRSECASLNADDADDVAVLETDDSSRRLKKPRLRRSRCIQGWHTMPTAGRQAVAAEGTGIHFQAVTLPHPPRWFAYWSSMSKPGRGRSSAVMADGFRCHRHTASYAMASASMEIFFES